MENFGQEYIDGLAQKSKGEYVSAVDTAEQYIKEHLDEELSVKQLANLAFVSSDHLTRLFKKKFGMTVTDYILDRRMKLAAELLKKPDLSITMVSNSGGFGSYSYFTEQFKRYSGLTPRDYQRRFTVEGGKR